VSDVGGRHTSDVDHFTGGRIEEVSDTSAATTRSDWRELSALAIKNGRWRNICGNSHRTGPKNRACRCSLMILDALAHAKRPAAQPRRARAERACP
jgi:hypothetical protein